MDTAKQTNVSDINLKHRAEPRLLPSRMSRFGCERDLAAYIWQTINPIVFLVFLSLTYCVCF